MKNALIVFIGLIGVFVVFLLFKAGIFSSKPEVKKVPSVIVGLSLGTLKEERWQKDRDFFLKRAGELGAKVTVLSANSDKNLQFQQIESLILQNVPVIVVVPQDDKNLAPLVDKAHEKGIKIIAYDRLIVNSSIDGYITIDYIKAGEQQAQAVLNSAKQGNFAIVMGDVNDSTVAMQEKGIMNVLQPMIRSGKVKIVYQDYTKEWKPENAYISIKKLLNSGVSVQGVVSMNDGMAGGVIKALTERGLQGKVPISGMDAELSGVQRVVEGTQTETSYLPVYLQAYKGAEVAVAFTRGESFTFNSTTKNGKEEVPTYLVQPISVMKENMVDTVVKDGFHTFEEVYQNIPQKKRPQK